MGSLRRSPRNPSRWEARYRDLTGHHRTKTFESRASAKAKAWLTSTETDMHRGSWIDPRLTATTLDVIAEHWMKSADGKRAGSIARDQSILANHVLPVLGHKAVGTITRHDVQQLVSDWAAPYTPSTVARHYASLRSLAGRRALSVPTWVTAMLDEHLAERGVTGGDPQALVFVSPDGEPLHYSNWRRRVWLPACAAVGLPELTFHDLKHTAATVLVEEGVDVKTAQVRLGHANPQTTLRVYAQVTQQADRAAAQRVGERRRPALESPPAQQLTI